MSLEAILTVGWPEASAEASSARTIHKACQNAADGYSDELLRQLSALRSASSDGQPIVIQTSEDLFRRRVGAFSDIKKFAGQLNALIATNPDLGTVQCEMDVFAYAFLKSAKNFDFFLPEAQSSDGPFRTCLPQWEAEFVALEAFEREGKTSTETDTNAYLALRNIISRKSARDERRALATLLVSGPSTQEEIAKDLGLPYGLAERILPTFHEIGTVALRYDRYVITQAALPRIVFGLREMNGIDLLAVL